MWLLFLLLRSRVDFLDVVLSGLLVQCAALEIKRGYDPCFEMRASSFRRDCFE